MKEYYKYNYYQGFVIFKRISELELLPIYTRSDWRHSTWHIDVKEKIITSYVSYKRTNLLIPMTEDEVFLEML